MSENLHLTYKQRYGFEDLPQVMRIGELSKDLRREMWNLILRFIGYNTSPDDSSQQLFFSRVLGEYQKRPVDEIDTRGRRPFDEVKNIIMKESAENTLQFIEILINDELVSRSFFPDPVVSQSYSPEDLENLIYLFRKHTAPYWFGRREDSIRIFQQTSKEEAEATAKSLEAIKNAGGFEGALSHLRDAAEFINQQKFAASIHQSINAVESVARSIEPNAKTLADALKKLDNHNVIKHPAFKGALDKLYGYTSDEPGIRHSLIDQNDANVDLPEALFFYCVCAASAGYLATIGDVKHKGIP